MQKGHLAQPTRLLSRPRERPRTINEEEEGCSVPSERLSSRRSTPHHVKIEVLRASAL